MQTGLSGPSKLLYNFYALTSRNGQLDFHTSACALKGSPRAQKKSWKARADTQRAPARKRLVPTLRPEGKSGKYEVAARPSKSRDEKRHRGQGFEREEPTPVPARTSTPPPPDLQEGLSFGGISSFSRDNAPHVGRTSWHKPGRPVAFRREGRLDRGSESDRRPSFSGSFKGIVSPRRRDVFRSRDGPARGAGPLDDSHSRRIFGDSLPSRNQWKSPQYTNGYDHDSRSQLPRGPMLRDHERYDRRRSDLPRPTKNHLPEEFETSTLTEPLKTLPDRFTSPPLLDGLLQSVYDALGPRAKPSPIQSLSLKHLFVSPSHIPPEEGPEGTDTSTLTPVWSQHLLASETGSGKSIAYLLPMIQYLKLTENLPAPLPSSASSHPGRPLPINPRGLILAPTHELSRQLSSFAKALLHNVRLRVLCASRANNSSSSRGRSSTASQLKRELDDTDFGMTDGAHMGKKSRPVDVLVGTPMKVLEMVRGWGWDKEGKIEERWDDARKERARDWVPGPPEAGLANIEWVVVDEADILFDKDFQESTRMLLADIARARGYTHPSFSSLKISSTTTISSDTPFKPLAYPFHLLLTSATIPSSLATYLTINHPTLTRLASPNLHQLPSTLKTEHHAWTSGNKNSDIEKRIKRVWADDASTNSKVKSKILIFCNKSSKVEDLGLYLTEKGVPNLPLTSTGQARHRGSNRHLAGFLKTTDEASSAVSPTPALVNTPVPASSSDPRVMITTSLLSRGLDFSPQIKHVFIVDEPRNMIDFLHRAGRSGRAGHEGKVVVFGKTKGRGSGNTREMKRKIGALAH